MAGAPGRAELDLPPLPRDSGGESRFFCFLGFFWLAPKRESRGFKKKILGNRAERGVPTRPARQPASQVRRFVL